MLKIFNIEMSLKFTNLRLVKSPRELMIRRHRQNLPLPDLQMGCSDSEIGHKDSSFNNGHQDHMPYHWVGRAWYFPIFIHIVQNCLQEKCVKLIMVRDGSVWCHRSDSVLVQVMAWCPTTQVHFQNWCWLVIHEVWHIWHSLKYSFTENVQDINHKNVYENDTFKHYNYITQG